MLKNFIIFGEKPNFLSSCINHLESAFFLNRFSHYKCATHESEKHSFSSVVISSKKRVKYTGLLLNYGFNQGQVTRIFNSPYSVLTLNEKDLVSNLTIWHAFNVKDKLFPALSGSPELLTLNPSYVLARQEELMSVFTKKDIDKLLVTCPKVFLEDFSEVEKKIQYIVHLMHVDQKSIVKSEALQFDLFYIKCRHNFMYRAGKFKVPKRNEKSKNPPLHKIFSRNMQTFLKLSELTEEEYIAFCKCFKEEEEDDIGSDSEEEYDSDDDI